MDKREICERKRKFSSFEEGMTFVIKNFKNRKKGCRNVYQCEICDEYHITSKRNKTSIKRKIMQNLGKKQKRIFSELNS